MTATPLKSSPFSDILKEVHGRPQNQGGKRNPNPNVLVRIFSSGVGVFHVNGWGAKKFDTSLETREIKLFGRDIPGFCRDIPGAPEKFAKKKFGFNFRSLQKGPQLKSDDRDTPRSLIITSIF